MIWLLMNNKQRNKKGHANEKQMDDSDQDWWWLQYNDIFMIFIIYNVFHTPQSIEFARNITLKLYKLEIHLTDPSQSHIKYIWNSRIEADHDHVATQYSLALSRQIKQSGIYSGFKSILFELW